MIGTGRTPTQAGWIAALWQRSSALRGYVLLSPALGLLIIALIGPFALLVGTSFIEPAATGSDWSLGLGQYGIVLEKPQYLAVLWHSIGIATLVAVLTVLLAYPAAYFIAFHVHTNKMIWLIIITLPFWTSYLLRVFAWKLILGFNGVINSTLMFLGLTSAPVEALLYNSFAVVVTLAHAWAAFAILPLFVSLQKIDRSLIEAAQDLGEGPFMTFLRVTLPLSMPGIVAALLLVFIPTVGDYVTPKLVGGPNGLMIGSLIQLSFGQLDNWPLGAAISVVAMLVVTAAVSAFLLGLEGLKRVLA